MSRVSPLPLLKNGLGILRRAWVPVLSVLLAFHLLLTVVISPLISWLFREALRANGMLALDFGALQLTGGLGVSIVLLLIILLLAFWIVVAQFGVLTLMLRLAYEGQTVTFRKVVQGIKAITMKFLRLSSAPLFFYLFLIVPLSGFGFVSVLSQGIAVPSFISGELMKSPLSAIIWILFMLLLAFLNLRFALSLPLFVLSNATGGRAMRLSWRLSRGRTSLQLFLAVVIVLVAASVLTLVLVVAAIMPTAIADEVAPAASPWVASFSLGVAQMLGMVLTAIITALITSVLLKLADDRSDQLPKNVQLQYGSGDPRRKTEETAKETAEATTEELNDRNGTKPRPRARWLIAALCVAAMTLGFVHFDTMHNLSKVPDTLVIGHRGFSDNGAENTIEGLEAAAAAGADIVEIDVMQTADKRFVVMHDGNLQRLAGIDANVKDLTLDELTEITVRDLVGHEGKIPSLETYMNRAAELEMPLLIEIKLGGLDTDNHVDLLIAELDELDAIDRNIFHTLDVDSVNRLKQLRPDASVGYILAFAGVDVPDTVADFVVIEEWSATEQMQSAAARAGLGFFTWTVNDEPAIRDLLRRDVDGIITDQPDLADDARSEMQDESGLAGTLIDAITRFVVVF